MASAKYGISKFYIPSMLPKVPGLEYNAYWKIFPWGNHDLSPSINIQILAIEINNKVDDSLT